MGTVAFARHFVTATGKQVRQCAHKRQVECKYQCGGPVTRGSDGLRSSLLTVVTFFKRSSGVAELYFSWKTTFSQPLPRPHPFSLLRWVSPQGSQAPLTGKASHCQGATLKEFADQRKGTQ